MTRAASAAGRSIGGLALAWALAVLTFAVVPTHEALQATVGDRETLTTQVGHFVEFAVLAALAAAWLALRSRRGLASLPVGAALTAWGAAVAYGAVIETVQIPLPYRDAQVSDLLIDAAGAAAGLLVLSGVLSLRERGGRRRVR